MPKRGKRRMYAKNVLTKRNTKQFTKLWKAIPYVRHRSRPEIKHPERQPWSGELLTLQKAKGVKRVRFLAAAGFL